MKKYQLALLDYLKDLRPGRLLDAGSGTNPLGKTLKEAGFTVFSLDLYDTGKPGDWFVKADMNMALPYIDAAFDYLVCSESLQYLENHAMVFREFKRVLRAGGSVILSIPNVLCAASRFSFMQRGYFPHFKPVRTKKKEKAWDSITYNPISMVDISEFAARNGFTVKDVTASKIKASNLPLFPFLKALYSIGLLFEKNREKAELIKLLSSRELLLGDHLIVRLSQKT